MPKDSTIIVFGVTAERFHNFRSHQIQRQLNTLVQKMDKLFPIVILSTESGEGIPSTRIKIYLDNHQQIPTIGLLKAGDTEPYLKITIKPDWNPKEMYDEKHLIVALPTKAHLAFNIRVKFDKPESFNEVKLRIEKLKSINMEMKLVYGGGEERSTTLASESSGDEQISSIPLAPKSSGDERDCSSSSPKSRYSSASLIPGPPSISISTSSSLECSPPPSILNRKH